MQNRTTSKKLEASVDALNFVINNEHKIWFKNAEGELKSREGMFKLDKNVGGYQLTKIVNSDGGETDPKLKNESRRDEQISLRFISRDENTNRKTNRKGRSCLNNEQRNRNNNKRTNYGYRRHSKI